MGYEHYGVTDAQLMKMVVADAAGFAKAARKANELARGVEIIAAIIAAEVERRTALGEKNPFVGMDDLAAIYKPLTIITPTDTAEPDVSELLSKFTLG